MAISARSARKLVGVVAVSAMALAPILLNGGTASAAQPNVGLGTADSFAVLAGSTVTNTGPSVIGGDLGVSPGTAITGFPPGLVNGGTMHAADAVASLAQNHSTVAYNDAAARLPETAVSADLAGQTLVAGVYTGPTLGLTGTVTLDAQGDPNAVFVFKAGSTLITATGSNVALINGASACNITWQVGSSATLGTNTTFRGTIIALTSITLNTNASVSGRVLARNGAVTLDSNVVTRPTCPVIPPVTSSTTSTPTSSSTSTPSSSSTTLIPTTLVTTTSTSTSPSTSTTSSTLPTTSSTLPPTSSTSTTSPSATSTSTSTPSTSTTTPPVITVPITAPPTTSPPTSQPTTTLPVVSLPATTLPATTLPQATTTPFVPAPLPTAPLTSAPGTSTTAPTAATVPVSDRVEGDTSTIPGTATDTTDTDTGTPTGTGTTTGTGTGTDTDTVTGPSTPLARTGSSTQTEIATGVSLLAVGALLVIRSRRQPSTR